MDALGWLKALLRVLAGLLQWREDSQAKKAVLFELEQESEERKERANEIDQQVVDAELFDLHERMRHYRRD